MKKSWLNNKRINDMDGKTKVFLTLGDNGKWYPTIASNEKSFDRCYNVFNRHEEEDGITLCSDKFGMVAVCDLNDVKKAKIVLLKKMREEQERKIAEAQRQLEVIADREKEVNRQLIGSGEFVKRVHLRLDASGVMHRNVNGNVPIENDLPPMVVSMRGDEVIGECYEDSEFDCEVKMHQMRQQAQIDAMAEMTIGVMKSIQGE